MRVNGVAYLRVAVLSSSEDGTICYFPGRRVGIASLNWGCGFPKQK